MKYMEIYKRKLSNHLNITVPLITDTIFKVVKTLHLYLFTICTNPPHPFHRCSILLFIQPNKREI